MRTSLRKIGNSVGILIPKPFLAEIGLQAGDPVDIRVRKGRILIEPIKRKKARAGTSQHTEAGGEPDPDGAATPPQPR